jgi:hypothetical protein
MRWRRGLALALLATGAAGAAAAHAFQASGTAIHTGDSLAQAGQQTTTAVSVSLGRSDQITAFDVTLTFDPSAVSVAELTLDDPWQPEPGGLTIESGGRIRLAGRAPSAPGCAAGTACPLFHVRWNGVAEGTSETRFANVRLLDGGRALEGVTVSGGVVRVIAAGATVASGVAAPGVGVQAPVAVVPTALAPSPVPSPGSADAGLGVSFSLALVSLVLVATAVIASAVGVAAFARWAWRHGDRATASRNVSRTDGPATPVVAAATVPRDNSSVPLRNEASDYDRADTPWPPRPPLFGAETTEAMNRFLDHAEALGELGGVIDPLLLLEEAVTTFVEQGGMATAPAPPLAGIWKAQRQPDSDFISN